MTEDFNLGETLIGTRGTYRKVPTPASQSTRECFDCALERGPDSNLCPGRSGLYLQRTTLNCATTNARMRFIWVLGSPDYTQIDEGGVV